MQQSKDIFRVGTDGVLLGALADVHAAKQVLEVGTGTSLITLMLAQRNLNAQFLALDINPKAVTLAENNFTSSVFSQRINPFLQDFKEFHSEQKFDLIVSNPPYFERSESDKDTIARQRIALEFDDLIKKSAEILSPAGILSVIIPFQDAAYFEKICLNYQLHPVRQITIYGIAGAVPKRMTVEFSREKKIPALLDFIIEKSPRKYSDQYLELTREFHVFKEK